MKCTLCFPATLVVMCILLCFVACSPPPSAAPSLTWFAISNGAVETTIRTVTLNNACTGSPTQYIASESSSFAGATWQTYDTAPSFTLSPGNGTKTVYFKVKNEAGESSVASDTITLNEDNAGPEETIMLPGDVPLVMVWIPAGTFVMGRYPDEQDSDPREDPQHEVTVPGFWIGKYEVTQAQWKAIMGTNPSYFAGYATGNRPVEGISWDAVQSFITALNAATKGQPFRLPSEAEWEYACRAGTTTRFYWGDDPSYTQIENYAWYSGNSEHHTHDVGGKFPNGFGLYDMVGNVAEFCEDDWHDNYVDAPSDGTAWIDSPRSHSRVIRGGGWYGDYGRSAHRYLFYHAHADAAIGFRLAR